MIVYSPMRQIDPMVIAKASGVSRGGSYYPRITIPNIVRPGLRGMGQVALPGLSDAGSVPWDDPSGVAGSAISGSVNIPGIGEVQFDTQNLVQQIASAVFDWLGIGAGRREADVIVPVQNALTNSWGPCVEAIRVGRPCNLQTFNQCYMSVWQGAVAFMQFVQRRDLFSDGRASEQALNGIMPYVDGSCGYHWPPPMHPTQFNCPTGLPDGKWGGGTIGGTGSDGILGAIVRAIRVCGGSGPPTVSPGPGGIFPHPAIPPTVPPLLGGFSGSSLLLIAGVAALALYGRRSHG